MAKKKTPGISQMPGGRYKIDKEIIIEGRRIRVYKEGFSSVAEAKAAMPSLIEARMKEACPYSVPTTFNRLIEQYEDYCSLHVRAQTAENIHWMLKKHIVPYFDGMNVSDAMTFANVKKFYNSKARGSDSPQRKNRVFSEFRKILDFAWKNRYITSESHRDLSAIVENIKEPPSPKKEKATWTKEQEIRFLDAIPRNCADFPMFRLYLYLGARIGEFRGLTWDCFDFETRTIAIKQQCIRANGGSYLTSELKTGDSYRTCQLTQDLANLIQSYKESLDEAKPNCFMFPSNRGPRDPLSCNGIRRKMVKYARKAGVPEISPHGLRHGKATAFMSVCNNMEEVKACAAFLGHSASMMADVYAHVKNVSQADIASRLDDR